MSNCNKPTEETCSNCNFFILICHGVAGYPACTHRDSGTRYANYLDEMDKCPKD